MAETKLRAKELVHLPGAFLEGGGQILRLASVLAAITSTPLSITNIRGNRSGGGGMKAQHLSAISWLACATGAKVAGMKKKSKDLILLPEGSNITLDTDNLKYSQVPELLKHEQLVVQPKNRAKHIDIGSPGAVTLVFQALLPFILFSNSTAATDSSPQFHLTILGGTNVTMSPSIDYVRHVLIPMLILIGLPPIHVHIHERGWITGRPSIGNVMFSVTPLPKGQSLPSFQLRDRGKIVSLKAVALGPRWSQPQFQRLLHEAVEPVQELKDVHVEIEFEESGHPRRLYLLLVATSANGLKLGRDLLYGADFDLRSKGKGRSAKSGSRSADVTVESVRELTSKVLQDLLLELSHGGCVDEHMRDQLVVFQVLADGASCVHGGQAEPSLHTKTARWVAEEVVGASWLTDSSCNGIGFVVGNDLPRSDSAKLLETTSSLAELHF